MATTDLRLRHELIVAYGVRGGGEVRNGDVFSTVSSSLATSSQTEQLFYATL